MVYVCDLERDLLREVFGRLEVGGDSGRQGETWQQLSWGNGITRVPRKGMEARETGRGLALDCFGRELLLEKEEREKGERAR